MKYFSFGLDKLDSYPKFFLGKNLEYRAISTSVDYAKASIKNGDMVGYRESLKNAQIVENSAKSYAKKNVHKYFKFQKDWMNFVKIIKKKYRQ